MFSMSKKRREGSRAKIKGVGDHKEFLKRITKTLYYGQLPTLPCLSLPVTEISCAEWSLAQRGRSLRRLHCDAAAGVARHACVSPCALVLALIYLERLRACNPQYLHNAAPADLFLVSLMVGNKFLQDDGEEDEVICSEWAASGGLSLHRLKKLELDFLNAIDWNVYVSEGAFHEGLCRLERRVALKQSLLRGFFTYGDLCAAGAGGLGPLLRALGAALALAVAAAAALAALLAAHAALLAALRAPPAPRLTPPAPPADPAPPAADNSSLLLDAAPPAAPMRCCAQWARQLQPAARPPPEPPLALWPATSVLYYWYRSSLAPVQRWLGTGVARGPPPPRLLGELGVLVASVSDR